MADLATIRAAIKTLLANVPDVGVVHDYERFAKSKKDFQTMYKSGNQILGWFFYRERTEELDGDTGEVRVLHYWRFYGFNGLSDSTETAKTFQALVEIIRDAFRADPTLGGVIDDNKNMAQRFGSVGLQLDAIENVMFFGILCHRARFSLVTENTEAK